MCRIHRIFSLAVRFCLYLRVKKVTFGGLLT